MPASYRCVVQIIITTSWPGPASSIPRAGLGRLLWQSHDIERSSRYPYFSLITSGSLSVGKPPNSDSDHTPKLTMPPTSHTRDCPTVTKGCYIVGAMPTTSFESDLRERCPQVLVELQQATGLSWRKIADRLDTTSQRLWEHRAGVRTLTKEQLLLLICFSEEELGESMQVVRGLLGMDSEGYRPPYSLAEDQEISAFSNRRSPRMN